MSLVSAARNRRELARARRVAARHARSLDKAIAGADPSMRNELLLAAQRQSPMGLR
ncbi:hypothetical protein [Desertihabitans brevis]|uniref:hypothetical protein n=1 Tax=Desertihabitans brevis TaxID=2268447 RepID=UPI001313F8F1|nr:hypothetical protein [Desertihabitans brevis]